MGLAPGPGVALTRLRQEGSQVEYGPQMAALVTTNAGIRGNCGGTAKNRRAEGRCLILVACLSEIDDMPIFSETSPEAWLAISALR